MDYRMFIWDGIQVTYDHRIDLAGAYVMKIFGKFRRIHAAHSPRPYWINDVNNNKVYLTGKFAEAFQEALCYFE